MKKVIFLIIMFLSILRINIFSKSEPKPEEINLLPDGDFEKVENGKFVFWRIYGEGKIMPDEEVKYQGKYSLKFFIEKKGSGFVESASFSVKPETLYIITLWYKATGFGTDTDKYLGVNAYANIMFKKTNGAEIKKYDLVQLSSGYPWSIGFPYKNVKNWEIATLIVKSPPEASIAFLRINLSSNNEDILPTIYLDNIYIREYKPLEAKGKVYVYEAENMRILNGEIVQDENAENKKAVVATKDKNQKGIIIFGPYTKDQLPGQYKIIFRLKIEDNTKNTPICALRVRSNGFLNRDIYTTHINANDFISPNKYQEFAIEAVKPPFSNSWFEFLIGWSGEITIYR